MEIRERDGEKVELNNNNNKIKLQKWKKSMNENRHSNGIYLFELGSNELNENWFILRSLSSPFSNIILIRLFPVLAALCW